MKTINFVDRLTVGKPRKTRDGYLTARVHAARTGVQTYLGREVNMNDRETVKVYRPEDEVMSVDSLGSYKGKPITVGHPDERVTADNHRSLSRGHISGVARDGESVALDVAITDGETVNSLETGGPRELSVGYVANIDPTPGTTPDGEAYDAVQRGIYVDHLAIVDQGRAGPEFRIGDGAIEWGAAPIVNDSDKEGLMPDQTRSVVVDGLSVTATDQSAQAITKLMDERKSLKDELENAHTEAGKQATEIETLKGKVSSLEESLKTAQSPETIGDAVRARAAVLEGAKATGMTDEETAKLSDSEIRRAVVAKSLGETAKQMSDAAIEGAYPYEVEKQRTGQKQRTGDASFGNGVSKSNGQGSVLLDMARARAGQTNEVQ